MNILEKFYSKPNQRRKFLEDYATKIGLDPLNPEHWYTISREHFYTTKVHYKYQQIET